MYKKFFNYSNELLCIANMDGYFIDVNSTFEKTLGYSKAELVSKKFIDFIHPDDKETTIKEMEKLSSGRQTLKFQNRYLDCSGNILFIEWNAFPDTDTGLIYAVARNVTDEKIINNNYVQLQSALTKNVIYATTDLKGNITQVNDKFCQVSGYSREELIGKTHRIVNSGFHDISFFKDMWKTISKGHIWTGSITNKRKDGRLYYLESIIIPIFDINKKIEGYTAIRFDITDKIEFEAKSKKILKILNETSSIAKIGGWELDVKTGELSWTDETFKILGVEKKNSQTPVLPQGLSLFVEEHKPIIDEAVSNAIELGIPYELELQAQSEDGDIKWIFTDGKPNYIDGKVATLSGTIQDIHDKKITEIKYNQERQKSIQNAKFAALGELSASIAHEINNPLGIISGYTELLKYQGNSESNGKLDAILKSCDRISYIVKNLKRFSRTDDEPIKTRFELTELTKEAISLVMPKIKRSLIRFTPAFNGPAYIYGNEIEIEQVIINLLNNSIDAINGQKEPWLNIAVKVHANSVLIEVTDSGDGIPRDIQLKMFEPFYTTKETNKGTGLGLSVAKGIVDDHNATIEIDDSSPNTLIRVTFNVAEVS